MTLSDHQWAFLLDQGRLFFFVHSLGWKLTAGRLKQYKGDVHWRPTSSHNNALALDLNLFKPNMVGDVRYHSSTEAHIPLGQHWEALSPFNRWGGRYEDGNHYERLTVSRHEAPYRWGWFYGQEPLWEDPQPGRTA